MDPFSIASAFLMHTGARHLQIELTSAQKKLISHPVSKLILLGAMFYVSTKSLLWSVILICVYAITVNVLLNEQHILNIFSRSWLQEQGFLNQKRDKDPVELYMQNIAKL